MPGTLDRYMLHFFGSFVRQIHRQVNHSRCSLHVLVGHLSDPGWNSCREKTNLQVFSALISDFDQNFLNIFFKAEFKHLVGFIEDYGLYVGEVDVSTLYMI